MATGTGAYKHPIIEILREHGGSATFQAICEEIVERVSLDEEDWEHDSSGLIVYRHRVAGALSNLKKQGVLVTPARTVWALADADFKEDMLPPSGSPRRRRASRIQGVDLRSIPESELRAMLAIPTLRQLAEAELTRREQSQTQREQRAVKLLKQELTKIRQAIKGNLAQAETDEKLCFWIELCYTLELYDYALALFSKLSEELTPPDMYARAKYIAQAAEQKLGR